MTHVSHELAAISNLGLVSYRVEELKGQLQKLCDMPLPLFGQVSNYTHIAQQSLEAATKCVEKYKNTRKVESSTKVSVQLTIPVSKKTALEEMLSGMGCQVAGGLDDVAIDGRVHVTVVIYDNYAKSLALLAAFYE